MESFSVDKRKKSKSGSKISAQNKRWAQGIVWDTTASSDAQWFVGISDA